MLAGGFYVADGRTIRPALLAEAAVAMGRELLIRGVPIEQLKAAYEAIQAIAAAPAPQQAKELQALVSRPSLRRYALLAEWLGEGVRHVRRPEDARALALHVRRVLILASFERTLARANAADLARSERAAGVRRAKERRTGR